MKEKDKNIESLKGLLKNEGVEGASELVNDLVTEAAKQGWSILEAINKRVKGKLLEYSVEFQLDIAIKNLSGTSKFNNLELDKIITRLP